MANEFVSVMKKVGEDVKVAWSEVVKFLPGAEDLASLIFGTKAAAAINVVNLIQQTVVTVEQKFAAAGPVTGTGEQKLAHVLSIVGPTVISELGTIGIKADNTFVTNVVNIVVGLLNVNPALQPKA